MTTSDAPKLGLALSGGGHRAAFFHIGVLAKLAELGLLRSIEAISTVSGGSIVGALYYLHVKNLLETKENDAISDADYVELMRNVECEYRSAVATNIRGSAWSSLASNFHMVKRSYSRTDRAGELYEQRFYAKAWGELPTRKGRIVMRDLLISPKGHDGAFDPYTDNQERRAKVPILLLEATTLNTGHNWRFEAMYVGEPPRQHGTDANVRADVDKNTILERTRWDDLPESCQNFPLGAAVVSSACFPGGFPPMQISGLFEDYNGFLVKLVDGGVHDNQGIEGLLDHGCTHLIISDGSGQMPDRVKPSTRMPAVLGRIVSIYGDAEREARLLGALEHSDTTAFMHLQSGLPAATLTPGKTKPEQAPPPLEFEEFGVHREVQLALANIRTDLDAFCDLEAWALMADGYQLAGRIVPARKEIAALGSPRGRVGWPFSGLVGKLGQNPPDPHFLKVLQVGKERFLRAPRLIRHGYAATNIVLVLLGAAVAAGLWLLLTPHGSALFIAALATLAALVIYFASDKAYVKPVAVVVFDTLVPALVALPLLAVAWLQLAAGRRWLRVGCVQAETAAAAAALERP